MALIRNQRDFGAGLLYIAFGTVGFYIAQEYGMGRAAKMGPGYFPTVLSSLLLLFGAVALIRSFIKPGADIGGFAWKAALQVCGATALFGVLLLPAGLIVALLALVLVSASASSHFKFDVKATLALVVLVTFCALVFVKGLGVPMPLLGTWFTS